MNSITLYHSPSCVFCKKAMDFLKQEGLPYVSKDVQTDPQARDEFLKLGKNGVPVFVVGDSVIEGFNPNAVLEAVDFKVQECPHCKTKLKLPKNKGKIKVNCPSCKGEFIIRT